MMFSLIKFDSSLKHSTKGTFSGCNIYIILHSYINNLPHCFWLLLPRRMEFIQLKFLMDQQPKQINARL